MSQLEIIRYGWSFFKEELSTDLLNRLKNITETTEIEGIDYVKSKLTENLDLIIEKIYRLTNEQNKQAFHELLYKFYFNRFLFYLGMDALMTLSPAEFDFQIEGIFLHRKPDNKYSIDKLAVERWFAEELTIPHLMMDFTEAISSKLIEALFDKANKKIITKSFNEKMMYPFAQIEDPVKKDLINKIKISRDILIKENDRNPYALTRICKKIGERYNPIVYTTLREKMKKHNIPTDIKKFTKIYG